MGRGKIVYTGTPNEIRENELLEKNGWRFDIG